MENRYEVAAKYIREAEAVLITASNGLSISEGYHIFADNEDFKRYFGKFRDKYGINCLIRGVFTPMPQIDHENYMKIVHKYLIEDYSPTEVMGKLYKLISDKNYFILTSNGDLHFQMNGFIEENIFEVEGNFDGLKMQSEKWHEQRNAFGRFITENENRKTLVLELGIGRNNTMIKAPTMQMVKKNSKWRYITLNMPQEILLPEGAKERSLSLPGDIAFTIEKLLKEMN